VLRRLPHPGKGFTQGLILDGGTVWESTGRYGRSSLRRYRLGANELERQAPLPAELFGEGICRAGDHIWQLTWRERVALRWQPDTLALLEKVAYNREGWGICSTGDHVVTSDGSSELVRRDPETLEPLGVVRVRCAGSRVEGLNDLGWSAGRVWANLLGRTYVAGIDPDSGEVVDIVDARAARERRWGDPQAIMNGLAPFPGPGEGPPPGPGEGATPGPGEFLLTGKGWRFIHHVRLVEGRQGKGLEKLLAG